MPHKDQRSQLLEEIASLRKELEELYKKWGSLNHTQVVALSESLDKKIVEYTQLLKEEGIEKKEQGEKDVEGFT